MLEQGDKNIPIFVVISGELETVRPSIHEDFRTLEIVQKAKRGELQDHMKTKNADSRHGRVVDLSEPLAAMLRDFVGSRTSGLVFCKPDGSQLMQRDILKHSLHPPS